MLVPVWFRYGVIATATLMLCSCQTLAPQSGKSSTQKHPSALSLLKSRAPSAPLGKAASAETSNATANLPAQSIDRSLLPVIYRQDPHAPPPAARQAQYAAGMRAACPCGGQHGGSQSCQPPSCGPQGCGLENCGIPGRLVGPRDEYLCDGGDRGLAVGVRKDWQVDGLEQEDTVGHYDTVDGRTIITPSNQVCIYAPRFGVVRRMIDLHEYARSDAAGGFESPLALSKIDENERASTSLAQLEPTIHRTDDPATLMKERQQLGELDRALVVEEFDGSLAAYADLQLIRAGTIDNGEKALIARASLAAISWAGDQAPQITIDERHAQASVRDSSPGTVYHLHDPKQPHLRLVKLASRSAAQPGDIVEFTLRWDNVGSQVMGNVTIMDHLTTRLEYVEGSAKSDVAADFFAEPNPTGSAVLRWEIREPIAAGKGGILQFKCKVR